MAVFRESLRAVGNKSWGGEWGRVYHKREKKNAGGCFAGRAGVLNEGDVVSLSGAHFGRGVSGRDALRSLH